MNGARIVSRAPCPSCGCLGGVIEERGGQDVVRCAACRRYLYCAPRSETGKPQRSIRTRPTMKPSTRYRILERDGSTCQICHRTDRPLVVDHAIPVEWFKSEGVDPALADDEENLWAVCEECNSGKSDTPVPIRLLLRALMARVRFRAGSTRGAE